MSEWRTIDSAPKDGTEILGYGLWAGEINGTDTIPTRCTIQWDGGTTDYEGFHWSVTGTDAYAAWMCPTHWMPLPPPPDNSISPVAPSGKGDSPAGIPPSPSATGRGLSLSRTGP